MPKIDWIGKGAVVRHHLAVPYRLLHCNGRLSAGDADSGNLLVQGDNLEALRALLPYYAGRVKCVYIDPPYNTGNEGWKYNDKVNSPQIRRWLDKTVGGEADDLCRHDKWLCMMYPRLRLLRDFLCDDGVIFISIDDNEQHRLRMLMDEIFGGDNFIASISWQGLHTTKNDAKGFSVNNEFILGYAKNISLIKINGVIKSEESQLKYKNRDNDPRGEYLLTPLHAKSGNSASVYDFVFSNGQKWRAPEGCYPRFSESALKKLDADNRIYLDPKGIRAPYRKTFKNEISDRMPPPTFWSHKQFGSTLEANAELRDILGRGQFDNPKPTRLIKNILDIMDTKKSIIMDSFAGSGTTAQAVLQQNKEDGGNRQFILVEMDKEISETITAKRIQKVIRGYKNGDKTIAPLGGGVRFCTLGTPLFDENGNIGTEVKFNDLAAHVFFSHTGSPIPKKTKTALLGEYGEQAIYLLYNGIMGDKSKNGGNILTSAILSKLPPPSDKTMRRVIYGEGVLLSKERLARENIDFRQIPYHIKMR